MRKNWLSLFVLGISLLLLAANGCGGGSADGNRSTSHDEISEFLEENPEFANPVSEPESEPLGLQ